MAIRTLEKTHARLLRDVENLYASLNVHDSFLELEGMSLDFVRTLFLARDLKINIRKRAIASFFEWDKLDSAVGGKANPIGKQIVLLTFYVLKILSKVRGFTSKPVKLFPSDNRH